MYSKYQFCIEIPYFNKSSTITTVKTVTACLKLQQMSNDYEPNELSKSDFIGGLNRTT